MLPLSEVLSNLSSPPILCFILGACARLLRSDLHLPDALTQSLSLYLLLAIGLKGGVALAADSGGFAPALVATLILGFSIPLWVYLSGRRLGGWASPESASLAAHYGSTSAVTFLACLAYLDQQQIYYEGYMTALLAIMEVPSLLVGMLLLKLALPKDEAKQSILSVMHHVVVGKSIVLLIGGMAIGFLAGKGGSEAVAPFFFDPFLGVLCLFMLDLGRSTAERIRDLRQHALFLLPFGIIAPMLHGMLGVLGAHWAGLSVGGATTLGIIAGSASYIAAPAAMRVAYPPGNHSLPLAASLGITFPFNLALGIPLLHGFAAMLGS